MILHKEGVGPTLRYYGRCYRCKSIMSANRLEVGTCHPGSRITDFNDYYMTKCLFCGYDEVYLVSEETNLGTFLRGEAHEKG